jgi:hypothetical protein
MLPTGFISEWGGRLLQARGFALIENRDQKVAKRATRAAFRGETNTVHNTIGPLPAAPKNDVRDIVREREFGTTVVEPKIEG